MDNFKNEILMLYFQNDSKRVVLIRCLLTAHKVKLANLYLKL